MDELKRNDELEDLKARIIACMDELTFLDLLGLDIADLVETFSPQIEELEDVFHRAVD